MKIDRRGLIGGGAAVLAAMPRASLSLTPQQRLFLSSNKNGFWNFKGSNLSRWQTALAAKNAGTGNARIMTFTDSTGIGTGAGSGGSFLLNGAKPFSWPWLVAKNFNSGVVGNASMCGDNGLFNGASETLPNFDPRISFTGGWSDNNAASTLGGSFLKAVTTTGVFNFAPTNSIDTIVVGRPLNTGLASATVSVDGGASLGTINENASFAFGESTFTCSPGVHTINLNYTGSGATFFLTYILAYLSSVKEVSVLNAGWFGATSNDLSATFANSPWEPGTAIGLTNQNLTIMENGIVNDMNSNGAISLATSLANNTALVNTALVPGDVILMSGPPSQPGGSNNRASYATQASYVHQMKALAYSKNVPMIDIWTLFGGVYQPSLMFDDVHPNAAGYTAISNYVIKALAPGFTAN